jgi:IS4 transposase
MEVAPMLGKIFERFVEKSPVSVMARGLLERVLNPKTIDEIFERVADRQYTRNLLFSVVFDLMSEVVCGSRKTLHAAYQTSPQKISVSVTSVYNKVDGVETETSASLVRYCADTVTPMIDKIGGALPPLLPGYRIKILDGNCLEATERRIRELRGTAAGPLPGKSLVVLDPSLKLMIDVFPCEDGHTQERALLEQVLPTVEAKDCWIEDRNFCTINFLFNVDKRDAFFIVRQHQNLPWEPVDKLKKVGRIDGAKVSEQSIVIQDHEGNELRLRRIRIHLDKPTRDGDRDVFVLTNLPKKVRAKKIVTLYRNRWKIETAFQELANHLNSEINTLGYPKAALFAFCVALIAYNVMSVIQAALRSVHGADVIEQNVSGYYIAEELSSVYPGMMIAIPEKHWQIFGRMTHREFADILRLLASKVNLRRFKKHPRGPKKPQAKRIFDKNHPHVSTFRLIAARKSSTQ